MSHRGLAAWFMVCVLSIAGCGGSGMKDPKWPDPVSVKGKITYGGQPLADGIISFIPEPSTLGQGASGITNATGEYVLESRWWNGKMKEGAIAGKYKVIISRMVKKDGSVWKPDPSKSEGPMTVGAKEEIPEIYSMPMKSKLIAEVSKEKPTHDFALDKKK